MQNTEMTVQISTKLNRSHAVTGEEALILPTMGRTEIDIQAVRASSSSPWRTPSAPSIPRTAASTRSRRSCCPRWPSSAGWLARCWATRSTVDWAGFESNYDLIRDHIARVVPGLRGLQRAASGRRAASCCRTGRATPAPSPPHGQGHAHRQRAGVHPVPARTAAPADHALARPVQHHHLQPQRPLPRHQEGPPRGLRQPGGPRRAGHRRRRPRRRAQRVQRQRGSGGAQVPGGGYPTAGAAPPPTSPRPTSLVPLDFTAEGSNTPASKSVVVRLEPSKAIRERQLGTTEGALAGV